MTTVRTPLCDVFGIERPIFAFTPSEKVAAAVSRAGGLGVLGAVRFNDPEELEHTLTWLDHLSHQVRIDYRPVHTYTMSNEIQYIEPKARVY